MPNQKVDTYASKPRRFALRLTCAGHFGRSPLSAWWCEGEKKTEAKRIATGNRAGRLVRCAPALTHNGVDAYSAGAQRSGCRAERRNFSRGWLIDAPGPSQSGADGEPVAAPDNRVCHGSCEEHEPRQPRSQVSFFVSRRKDNGKTKGKSCSVIVARNRQPGGGKSRPTRTATITVDD